MPGRGPDINGLYLHPDGTNRIERYDGELCYPIHQAPWTFADQWRVAWGGEPTTANRRSQLLNAGAAK